jgi:predicted PurR-regulated permease PerM
LIGLQALMGSLIEPPMTGRAVDLSPLVVLTALAFWGLCWGLIGVLLAIPLTVVLKLVLEHVDTTRPFARLLAGD